MADSTYDIIIIGAGPGGYVAAIRGAQLGLQDGGRRAEHLGGICLNWGCIPTKALLRSAEIYHYMHHAKDYGLSAENVGFDAAADGQALARSRRASCQSGVGIPAQEEQGRRDLGRGEIDRTPGEVWSRPQDGVQPQHPPKGAHRVPATTRPSTSSSPPAPARARCLALSPTAS